MAIRPPEGYMSAPDAARALGVTPAAAEEEFFKPWMDEHGIKKNDEH